jgi:maltose O-acetyltransferase
MNRATSRLWALKVNVIAASPLIVGERRAAIWRNAGMTVGEEVDLRAHSWIFSDRLAIGNGTLVGYGCYFENREMITVGARCSLAPQITIATSNHDVGGPKQRAGRVAVGPVHIGDGTWVGTRVTILSSVRIGRGCVIAAGALVTEDCEPNSLYAGVPARRKRELPES